MKNVNYFKNYENIILRIILLMVGLATTGIGTALIIKVGLGQSAVSSLSRNVEYITGIKSGTVLAAINYICFILQIIILRREFKVFQILQLVITTFFGYLVNYFCYEFYLIADLNTEVYIFKLLLVILGLLIMAFGISGTIKADLLFLPYEGLCNTLVYKTKKAFGTIRPITDGIIIFFSIVLISVFHIPNTTVREGTVIVMIFLGKVVDLYSKYLFKTNK